MADEVKTIDQVNELVTQLRAQHEKAMEGVIHSSDFAAFQEKMNADMNSALDALKGDVESKLNRPPAGATEQTRDEKAQAHSAAFIKYARGGDLTAEEAKILATDNDTTGGYATSPTVSAGIEKNLRLISPIRNYANVETISGNEWKKLLQVGTAAGGWTAERTSRTATGNPTMGMLTIPLCEMYAEPGATQTQLDDSVFDVESWLAAEVAETFGYYEGLAFVSGTGVGQPTGILTNSNVSHVASGHATQITTDGMRKAYYGLNDVYARNAIFGMKRASVLALMLLTDGEGQYLWKPSLQVGQPTTFDGVPVVEVPDMPAIGAGTFPVFCGDLRAGYKIVDKATVATLRDPYSSKPNVLFYTTKRTGGAVLKAEAIIKLEIAAS